jgi:hypothetical protein
MRNKKGKILAGFTVAFLAMGLLFANRVLAAGIFFGANGPDVSVNSKLEVGVYLNTENELVNAVGGEINFPADVFDFQGFYTGGSVLTLWITPPTLTASGTVSFAGIVPGGLNTPKGYLFSLILTAKQKGSATVSAGNESILLNDGLGTAASVSKAPLVLNVTDTSNSPAFVPLYDATPPEPFTPQVVKNADVFDGKWFVTFIAEDKGAGIDRYEVMETPPIGSFAGLFSKNRWESAQSPHLLKDQSLRSSVYVKAIDRAGNVRLAEVKPMNALPLYENYLVWSVIILLAVILVGYRLLMKKRLKNRQITAPKTR